MYDAAQKGVAECQQCDRAKASFAVKMTGMQSLLVMGLGYRWSLDFAGPLVTTRSKKRFVLIGINVTLDEIRRSSARRVRKTRLAFQQT
jgi:hypothetical protein